MIALSLLFIDVDINESSTHFTYSMYRKKLKEYAVIFCSNMHFKYRSATFQIFIKHDIEYVQRVNLIAKFILLKILHWIIVLNVHKQNYWTVY